jgi:hypothetical protein
MRAHFAAHIQAEFHLIECALKLCGGNGSEYCVAFVAHDIPFISTNDTVQAPAAVHITERLMRKDCRDNAPLNPRAVANRAIAWRCERRHIAVSERAATVIAVTERNASTARRFR